MPETIDASLRNVFAGIPPDVMGALPTRELLLRRGADGSWRVEARGVHGWRGSIHYNANCARLPR